MGFQFNLLKKALPLYILFFSFSLFAAKVVKINKKRGFIYINAGTNEGFKKKEKVCFLSKKNKKVACGKVYKARKTKSTIKVSKKRVKKIKKNYQAILSKKSTPSPSKSKKYDMAIKVLNSLSFLPMFSYNNLAYQRPTQGDETIWSVA